MSKSYAQQLVNDLYEEGDRDHHFFTELLGFVGHIYPEPFMRRRISLQKSEDQQFEDALRLAQFFIESNAYVGFFMPEYGKLERTFDNAEDFKNFLWQSANNDVDYLKKITTEDRYTVGLMKIQTGAKAPLITQEIEKIFSGTQDNRIEK